MHEALSKLSREQLYERVWQTPIHRLADEFGVSGVAVAKRCRKLTIPTPPRGYWSKLEFGKAPPRAPLGAAIPASTAPVPVPLSDSPWPHDVSRLCERAQLLITVLQKEKADYRGMQRAHVPYCPRTDISKNSVETAARAYHAILVIVEAYLSSEPHLSRIKAVG
jgi:hypothetical protein